MIARQMMRRKNIVIAGLMQEEEIVQDEGHLAGLKTQILSERMKNN